MNCIKEKQYGNVFAYHTTFTIYHSTSNTGTYTNTPATTYHAYTMSTTYHTNY